MNTKKRLTRIETLLRPVEAVLLWLAEMLPLDIDTFLEKVMKCLPHEDPRVRISEMVAKAVRESLNEQTMTPAEARNAEFQAYRQTAFLATLVIKLHILVTLCCSRATCVALPDSLRRLQLQAQEDGQCSSQLMKKRADDIKFVAEIPKEFLDDLQVSEALKRMLQLRETVAAISNQYFDGHQVLVAGAERSLNESIQELQSLALAGKESQPPSSGAVDLAALESSIKRDVPQEVEALVVGTDALVLECLGQREAAWKLRQKHAQAIAERRISECANRAGIT